MDNENQQMDQTEKNGTLMTNQATRTRTSSTDGRSKTKQVTVQARYAKPSQPSRSRSSTPVSVVAKPPTPPVNVKQATSSIGGAIKQPVVPVDTKIRSAPNNKSKPPIHPNSQHSNSEENSTAIVQARYWRTQYQLLQQRKEFEKERQRMFDELKTITNDRMEIKRRTHEYTNLKQEITQFQLAMELLEIQMPQLIRVQEKRYELETKLQQFTSALQLFLACVMIVDSKNVSVPKTEKEMAILTRNIVALNTNLKHLSQTLGVDNTNIIDNKRIAIVTAVHQLLETTDLFFAAFSQVNENKALLEKLEELKTTEDSLKAYLFQLEQQQANPNYGVNQVTNVT